MKAGIDKIYSYRQEFLVIGMTGRTGSGCTTAATLLSQTTDAFNFPDLNSFEYANENDRRKTSIVLKFAKENRFQFVKIQVKDIITAFILEHSFDAFIEYLLREIPDYSIPDQIWNLKSEYILFHKKRTKIKVREEDDQNEEKINSAFNFHFVELPTFSDKLKSSLKNEYTSIYQLVANNIRSTGNAFPKFKEFDISKTDSIVLKINKFIKLIRKKVYFENKKSNDVYKKKAFIVIDALRNPFEINFLKERYSAFYVISINTSESDRKQRLVSLGNNEQKINVIDKQEYPEKLKGDKLYISQNIQSCIELADIHIHNPLSKDENYNELKRQLLWYYSLMIKPGMIPPTPVERVMQIAYTAKLNSGCLSRQVGAVVTDKNYSIKSIGWNNSPQNQVPCILRNASDLINASDKEAYSDYELSNKNFRDFFASKYQSQEIKDYSSCGNNISFCFKEVQNSLNHDNNQVHTRSLHAEENAFLQLTKYGTVGIDGGILFTTASPCELCSKKAYQLGITKIYYIDPYPGIATTHILKGGTHNPSLLLYRGVVGGAYFKLYHPFLSYKDEIKQVTNLDFVQPSIEKTKLETANKKIIELEKRIEDLAKPKATWLQKILKINVTNSQKRD